MDFLAKIADMSLDNLILLAKEMTVSLESEDLEMTVARKLVWCSGVSVAVISIELSPIRLE